jgi:23S rRNA (uracil1939-C5)-methyltransferase
MEKLLIEKLDNNGRGISYYNNKIIFIPNTLPNEEVIINITKENKKYYEGEVIEYIRTSPLRIESLCPYYKYCGGCNLLHTPYEETLKYKKEKLTSILNKYANINKDIEIIPSPKELYYRNKITLKAKNNKYGYFQESTHKLIEIDKCLLAEEPINNFIKDLKYLNITNGELVIRSNYNKELLINITTKEELNINIEYLKKNHKIVGIIVNNKTIYGESSFIEIINHLLFTVSYDSFFQINRYITSKLFDILKKHINENEVVLDLYCGVGTLGINIADKSKRLYGIEIVKNAVLNAINNSKINKRNNIEYMLGDVSICLPKIKDKIDTIIVDPPRSGLDPTTKNTIIKFNPSKIIYISCDPITLARDLKELKEHYLIKEIKGLDMFPYTHHCESITVLEKR